MPFCDGPVSDLGDVVWLRLHLRPDPSLGAGYDGVYTQDDVFPDGKHYVRCVLGCCANSPTGSQGHMEPFAMPGQQVGEMADEMRHLPVEDPDERTDDALMHAIALRDEH